MFYTRIGLTKLLQKLKFLNYQPTGRYSSLGEVEPTDDNSKHYIYIINSTDGQMLGQQNEQGSSKILFPG
jgi:hypothetical protein